MILYLYHLLLSALPVKLVWNFGSSSRTFEPGPVSAWEAIGLILLFFGLIELIKFGKTYYARQPFIAELRRQQPPYYSALTRAQQRKFEKRVSNFILRKRFVPRGAGFVITKAMQVRIAACATQVSFGLWPIYFTHFKTILVYPDRYYSDIFKRYHTGEVSMRGFIVLSWKDFEAGYSNYSDGYNLGLHEMAHALHLENGIRNAEYDFLNQEYLQRFHHIAEQERAQRAQQEEGFLRLYACTDSHEFFAVCVESFFERPQKFNQQHPDLYQALTKLLHQDPLKGVIGD